MSGRSLLTLLLVGLGIFFAGTALTKLVYFVLEGTAHSLSASQLARVVAPSAVQLFLGGGLVLSRNRLAARWAPHDDTTSLPVTSASVQALALLAIATYFIIEALGQIGAFAVLLAIGWADTPFDFHFMASVVKCLVALGILIGRRRLVGVWRSIRTYGVPQSDARD